MCLITQISSLILNRRIAAWTGMFAALMLISGPIASAPAKHPAKRIKHVKPVKPAGSPAWDDFPRAYQVPRYEMDIDHNPDYVFGVTKAFKPYQDPDRKEAEDLPNPLDNPDFRSYKLIVIVNKRDDPFWGRGQTMRVYQRGQPGLHYYWLISTGRKGFDTPAGYYRPQAFSSRHYSSKYDAPMQWAVFFNRGMALHSSLDRQAMKEMGHEAASHGCVHVEDYRAQELFHLVGHSGYGSVDVIGGNGRKTGKTVASYKTLIIVAPAAHWSGAGKATKPREVPLLQPAPEDSSKSEIEGIHQAVSVQAPIRDTETEARPATYVSAPIHEPLAPEEVSGQELPAPAPQDMTIPDPEFQTPSSSEAMLPGTYESQPDTLQ